MDTPRLVWRLRWPALALLLVMAAAAWRARAYTIPLAVTAVQYAQVNCMGTSTTQSNNASANFSECAPYAPQDPHCTNAGPSYTMQMINATAWTIEYSCTPGTCANPYTVATFEQGACDGIETVTWILPWSYWHMPSPPAAPNLFNRTETNATTPGARIVFTVLAVMWILVTWLLVH